MSTIFTEQFAGGSGDMVDEALHWNANQTSPMVSSVAVYGWVVNGSAASYPNHDLLTTTMLNRFPGTADYTVTIAVKFTTLACSRHLRVWGRMTDDENGYFAKIDTNFGAPVVSLYRAAGGVETLLQGPTSCTLAAGQDKDVALSMAGNDLTVDVGGVEILTHTETDANLIYGNYRMGFASSGGQPSLGPLISNLRVADAVDDSGKTGDYILYVGDDVYGTDEQISEKITINALHIRYFTGLQLDITRKELHTAPTWRPEQDVKLTATDISKTAFRGRIRQRTKVGQVGNEHVKYTCFGPRALAKFVNPEHPVTEAGSITWNSIEEDEDYDADYAGKTVGAIIQWFFDQNLSELRDQGAIDANPAVVPYVAADITAMDVVPTRFETSGDFEQVLATLLSKQPNFVLLVDPDTFKWRFIDWTSLSVEDIDYTAGEPLDANQVRDDTTGVYTAIKVRSYHQKFVDEEASTLTGSLSREWNFELGKDWTPERSKRSSLLVTVDSLVDNGAGDGHPVIAITADSEMFNAEWTDCVARATTGNMMGHGAITVLTNSKKQLTLTLSGGLHIDKLPVAGDLIRLEDSSENDSATELNGFKYIHRRFKVADTSKQDLVKNDCSALWLGQGGSTANFAKWTQPVQPTFMPGSGVILAGYNMTQFIENKGRCDTPEDYEDADVKFTYTYRDTKTRLVRIPATGWRGKAYSEDASKWDGGGDPDPDDWGVKRVFRLEDNEWEDDSQDAAISNAATNMLASMSGKPFIGNCKRRGIDWTYRILSKSVTFSTTLAAAGSSTGMESAYIVPFEVTYDFLQNSTTLALGDKSSFAARYEELKNKQIKDSESARLKKLLKRLEQMEQCRQQSSQPKLQAQDLGSICSTRVRGKWGGGKGGNGGNLPPGLEGKVKEIQDGIAEAEAKLNEQKETEQTPDPDTDDLPDGMSEGIPDMGGASGAPPVVVSHDGTFWARRLGSTTSEERWQVNASPLDATKPKMGRDNYLSLIGPGEMPFGEFHHQQARDTASASISQTALTNIFSKTPLADTELLMFRDGTTESVTIFTPADYSISGRTITMNSGQGNAGDYSVLYATQLDKMRRSETMLSEIGQVVSDTETLLAEAGHPISVTHGLLAEVL